MPFYTKYVKLCNQIGKTPSAVAQELGISKTAVSHWKARSNNPTAKYILKIAEYFDVPVSCFDDDGSPDGFDFDLQLFAEDGLTDHKSKLS